MCIYIYMLYVHTHIIITIIITTTTTIIITIHIYTYIYCFVLPCLPPLIPPLFSGDISGLELSQSPQLQRLESKVGGTRSPYFYIGFLRSEANSREVFCLYEKIVSIFLFSRVFVDTFGFRKVWEADSFDSSNFCRKCTSWCRVMTKNRKS